MRTKNAKVNAQMEHFTIIYKASVVCVILPVVVGVLKLVTHAQNARVLLLSMHLHRHAGHVAQGLYVVKLSIHRAAIVHKFTRAFAQLSQKKIIFFIMYSMCIKILP